MTEYPILRDLIVLFGLGVAVVLLFHRARLPPIVGFLITGVLCGPHGFGLIDGIHEVEALAEIGVVLLLFTVGIEFSLQQLVRLRAFLLTGGGLQVGVTIAATALAGRVFGVRWQLAIFLGMLVALSSTAIVLRIIADRGEMDTPHGRSTLGILIFQDLCVVPMMLAVPFLAGRGEGFLALVVVALKALLFVAAAVAASRWVVPRLLHHVVATRKREVFLLTIILLCLGTAWASSRVGLSLALGAFIAGLLISDSEYSHQALGEILPLREVFNSLFFVSIGMLLDVSVMLRAPGAILGVLAATIALKTAVTAMATWAVGQPIRIAIVAGLSLAQIGEFSFVLATAGTLYGLLDAGMNQIVLAVAVGSMIVTPALMAAAPRVANALEGTLPARFARGRHPPEPLADAPAMDDHVIIVGYGLNGRNLARVLGRANIPFVVVEMNPSAVRRERGRGRPILYGDATRPEVLTHAGVQRARVLVVAISDAAATRGTVHLARRLNPPLHIVVRSRYVQEMEPLFALGTNEVVPEEFETSIEIFARVLRRYLVPVSDIEQSIREIRRDAYDTFRTMADAHTPATGLQRILADLALEVRRVQPGSALAGATLASSGIRERSGATVAAIQHADGTLTVNPVGSATLGEGDILLLLGVPAQLASASALWDADARAGPP